jgi:alpha-beta hydrolase superfamily lysophospholipase
VATPRWLESAKTAVAEVQAAAERVAALSPTLLMLAGDERITNLVAARHFAFRAYAGQRHKVIEYPGMFHELEKEPAVRDRVVSETIAWFRSH